MSEIDKEKDIDQLMYRELPPDRYCYIHNYIVDLKNQLQQKENIIKEVREYIEKELKSGRSKDNQWLMGCYDEDKKILQILDKENK